MRSSSHEGGEFARRQARSNHRTLCVAARHVFACRLESRGLNMLAVRREDTQYIALTSETDVFQLIVHFGIVGGLNPASFD
jgi:hypothetical protein